MALDQLGQTFATTGIAPGYMAGVTSGASLRDTLARAGQTEANTAKTLQMTPHEVESARLGNLQGQATERAGGFDAKAKLEAEQAKAAFAQLPYDTKKKMADSIKQQSMDALSRASEMLRAGTPVKDTLGYLEQTYPEITKDPSWKAQAQKYMFMPPEKAASEVDFYLQKMASTDFLSSMEGQGAMIKEDQQQAGRMAQIGAQQAGAERVAQIGADARAATGGSLTGAELQQQYLAIYLDPNKPIAERKQAKIALDYLAKAGTTSTSSQIPGLEGKTVEKNVLPDVGGQSPYDEYKAAYSAAKTQAQRDAINKRAREKGVIK